MNRKKIQLLILICLFFILSIAILYFFNNKKAKDIKLVDNKVALHEVDLNTINELVIGSEAPKIIYANKEKVIFDSCGIYMYDMRKKALVKTFDPLSLHPEKLMSSSVTQDGKQLILSYFDDGFYFASYCYSFDDNLLKEISESESLNYVDKVFQCEYISSEDKLYNQAAGDRVVKFSEEEYLYLTFSDWSVHTIRIVYVKDNKETVYKVFEKK